MMRWGWEEANRYFGRILIFILLSRNRKDFLDGFNVKDTEKNEKINERTNKGKDFWTFYNHLNI